MSDKAIAHAAQAVKIVNEDGEIWNFGVETTPENEEGVTIIASEIHDLVHQGKIFTGGHTSLAVANNSYLDILVIIGARKVGWTGLANASGKALFSIYEAPPNVTGGTSVRVWNNNRGADETNPPFTMFHTPSVVTPGSTTLHNNRLIPGGTGAGASGKVGDELIPGSEIIFAANTKYLIRIQNTSGGAADLNFAMEGYAEDEN